MKVFSSHLDILGTKPFLLLKTTKILYWIRFFYFKFIHNTDIDMGIVFIYFFSKRRQTYFDTNKRN